MLFSDAIPKSRQPKTRHGRVLRVQKGLVDVIPVGGNSPIIGAKLSDSTPSPGDRVIIQYLPNGEVLCTPTAS